MVVLELRITTMPSSLARLDGLIDSFAEDKMNRWKGNESNRMNQAWVIFKLNSVGQGDRVKKSTVKRIKDTAEKSTGTNLISDKK
jgi:hypothetical protein